MTIDNAVHSETPAEPQWQLFVSDRYPLDRPIYGVSSLFIPILGNKIQRPSHLNRRIWRNFFLFLDPAIEIGRNEKEI